MYSSNDEIKAKHKGDIPTLWSIYVSEKPFYKNLYFQISFGITLLILGFTYFSATPTYTLIVDISSAILSIMPNLLGFNLGAYILIVGFGSTEILSLITQPLKQKSNFSFYQILNGVLGVAVIVQILTLLVAFLFHIWDKLQVNFVYWIIDSNIICGINYLGLFIILLFSIYSILLLINVVKHVFMFAQTVHLCIYTVKLNEAKKEAQREKEQQNPNKINVIIEKIDLKKSSKKKDKKK